MGKCSVCGTPTEKDETICPEHSRAEKNLREGYRAWKNAYGQISITDYLARVIALTETGERVRELARFYQRNQERWDN